MSVRRRDILWANLNPARGSEQAGRRPVVVVSGDTMNTHASICIVCPVSSRVKEYPGSVALMPSKTNNLKQESEILVSHIRAVSQSRLGKRIGKVTQEELAALFAGLHDIFTY